MGSLKLTDSSQPPLNCSASKSDAERPSDHMPCAIARGKPKARAVRSLMWIGFTSPDMSPYRRPRPEGARKLLVFIARGSGAPSTPRLIEFFVAPAGGRLRARKVQVSSQRGSE